MKNPKPRLLSGLVAIVTAAVIAVMPGSSASAESWYGRPNTMDYVYSWSRCPATR